MPILGSLQCSKCILERSSLDLLSKSNIFGSKVVQKEVLLHEEIGHVA